MKQGHIRMIKTEHLAIPAILLTALLAFPSCEYDHYDAQTTGGMAVELSIRTRAISSTSYTYEVGSTWENYINIAEGDYRIYFFTNDKNDAAATDDSDRNTLIAEFVPKDITAVDGSYYTQYTLSGDVGDDIAAYSNFKVVVLANWGTYPTVSVGTTTIDALVEGEDATFSAETFLNGVDSTHLIPFYGVREYEGVEWKEGWRTTLEGEITMLRALAKVEVVMSEDSDIDSFGSVSIVRYNSQGYCAPTGVYLKGDYDHGSWEQDFTDGIHLVGGGNSASGGSAPLIRQSDSTSDVWTIYLPEYDNTSTDYSYLSVRTNYQMPDDDPFIIYFGNYTDGTCTAYTAEGNADDRYDIYRNYLYRFYVTIIGNELLVEVESWENVFDNEWSFGEYSHLIYADDDINNFTGEDGYIYASLVEEGNEDNPTVYLQKVSATTSGYVRIPETVTHLGYTYTVVMIGSYCFEADTEVTFIDIPETVTYIDTDAFHNDLGLVGIAVHSETPPECAEDAFEGDDLETITLYVPENSVDAYKTVSPWSSFQTIEGINFVS